MALEMPLFLNMTEIAEILVKYRNGPIFIRKLLLNFPDQISSGMLCFFNHFAKNEHRAISIFSCFQFDTKHLTCRGI